jgi:hypothetical protein
MLTAAPALNAWLESHCCMCGAVLPGVQGGPPIDSMGKHDYIGVARVLPGLAGFLCPQCTTRPLPARSVAEGQK